MPMYSVYQHWDPLKVCIVGKSYPPEFYSWIKNPKTRSTFEKIAIETEEDYQSLIKLLKKFNVEVLRPDIPKDTSLLFNSKTNSYIPPPMTPRDIFGMYDNIFTVDDNINGLNDFYNNVKDKTWPDIILNNKKDLLELPQHILSELYNVFDLENEINNLNSCSLFYTDIFKYINNKCIIKEAHNTPLSTACTTRIGKDIYYANSKTVQKDEIKDIIGNNYRIKILDVDGHTDGIFCPVVPGLIISLEDIPTYKDTFPEWEVVYLPDQSWVNVKPFLDLKEKNQGKWWIPGEEYNDDVTETVNTWMSNWVGYVEETVFDINMLVINEKNVVVNNYNKQVFDALERHGVTPHICNFRHRYFWDGGLHCITSDVSREGVMKDYFPERG